MCGFENKETMAKGQDQEEKRKFRAGEGSMNRRSTEDF